MVKLSFIVSKWLENVMVVSFFLFIFLLKLIVFVIIENISGVMIMWVKLVMKNSLKIRDKLDDGIMKNRRWEMMIIYNVILNRWIFCIFFVSKWVVIVFNIEFVVVMVKNGESRFGVFK